MTSREALGWNLRSATVLLLPLTKPLPFRGLLFPKIPLCTGTPTLSTSKYPKTSKVNYSEKPFL